MDLIFQHTYWWPHGEAGLYRPVTTLSYLFNYAVLGNGDRQAGYHWLNFLLHAGNVVLVYLLVSRLIPEFWPPVFIAGLWAVHPVLTESVTNIAGRADLIATSAVLAGLLLYLKSTEAVGWRRVAWLAGLMAATAAGVFAKESAIVIPGVIALYEFAFWRERKQARGLLLGTLATLPPLALMLIQRAKVLAASPPAAIPFVDNPIIGANWWAGRATALKVMACYLWLAIWPAKLSTDYSYPQIPVASGALEDWLALAVVLAVVVTVFLLYRRSQKAFFFAVFAFVALLPASNLLFPIGTIMAERLLYLPSIGLMMCLVLAVYAGSRRIGFAKTAPAVLCLVAIAFTGRTWARNADWRDDITLARSAVEACPRSFKSHKILAAALLASDPGHSAVDTIIDQASQSGASLPVGELRSQQQSPVVQALADHLTGETIGSRLQGRDIVDGQKRIVILAEADLVPVQFLFDEGVTVEIVGGLEREERRHAHHHRPQRFIPQVEIVVREATPLRTQDAVVGILGGELGHGTAEGRPLFHALQDEIHAVPGGPLHAVQTRGERNLLCGHLFRPTPWGSCGCGRTPPPTPDTRRSACSTPPCPPRERRSRRGRSRPLVPGETARSDIRG